MIFALIVTTFLIGEEGSNSHWPKPYLGYGFSAFKDPESGQTEETSRRMQFLTLAAPFTIKEIETDTVATVKLIFLPDMMINPIFFALNLGFGPEVRIPTGFRQLPSAWIVGAQAGFHYNVLSPPERYSTSSRQSGAFLMNFVFGPEFDVAEHFTFRIQINPRLMLGHLAKNTVRTDWHSNVGLAFAFNFQASFD